jgi:acyl-CoA reductase-like NAD-dependent aldehyde dehydrogenase
MAGAAAPPGAAGTLAGPRPDGVSVGPGGGATGWAALPVRHRLRVLGRARRLIAADPRPLAQACARPGASEADILLAEVLPLLDAIRFLERAAERLLAARRRRRFRPLWLFGTSLVVRRLPMGRVLLIGPRNYPLLLPGVQTVQALAAGNQVRLKPAPGCAAPMALLASVLARAGLPSGALELLDDTDAAATAAIAGADLVVLTGASATGRAVLTAAAAHLVPCIMELSGDDPFVVLSGADMQYAAAALRFGRAFNGGDTCIAPRRVIVAQAAAPGFAAALGASDFTVVADAAAAVAAANAAPAQLGAAVFGPGAEDVARALRAGCVVVGDAIAPTADPRLPFGGAGLSGFGTTRGPEGLLAMTRPQAIVVRRRPERRHLAPLPGHAAPVAAAAIRALHGGVRGWAALLAALRR